MTEDEESALVRDQYSAGHQHGIDTANVINERFPTGSRSTRFVRRKLRKIVHQSFSYVPNAFLVNGIEARFRQPFAEGFVIGLRERDAELASYIDHKVTNNFV